MVVGRIESWSGALALALACSVASPASAEVLRDPYLQSITSTSVVVMWQTDFAEGLDSLVHYGTNPIVRDLSETGVATDSPTTPGLRNHAVTITGLIPNTRYFYDVGTSSGGIDAGGTPSYSFVTAPIPGSILPFQAWIVGDSGIDGVQQRAVRDSMLEAAGSDPPDLFLHVGDQAYNSGTNPQFTDRMFAIYAETLRRTPYYPALGNHEASNGFSDAPTQSGPFFEAFSPPHAGQAGGLPSGTEAYYAFNYANMHFIVLDSDDSATTPGSAQLTWLAADLASVPAAQQWIIAWFHHPPYTRGTHNSDLAIDSGGRMTRIRENVLSLLEAAGVDVVLSGHSHSYERSYLLSRAYGYGTSPNFATPNYEVLLADGRILETGDGKLSGDGPYRKGAGRVPYGGTLYVVAGHGGNTLGGPIDHPVMQYSELVHGSVLLFVDATMLRLRNVRLDGTVGDEVWLHKPPRTCGSHGDCDDLRACTLDTCAAGSCQNTAISCPTGQSCEQATGQCLCIPGACTDDDACTDDSCDAVAGCTYSVIDCDDQEACTEDACDSAIGCTHVAVGCDDNDACTVDGCSTATGCFYEATDCDDDDACTADSCDVASGCAHAAISCDDGDACTVDGCEAASGCTHETANCDDGSACTNDSCDVALGCQYATVLCDDGDACTVDSCDIDSGCEHENDACNDDDACTVDACDPVAGCSYSDVVCDDGNGCTEDYCDSSLGCLPNFTQDACDDGSDCTIGDHCEHGVCTGSALDCSHLIDACHEAMCNPNGGQCETPSRPDGTPCPNGTCQAGACIAADAGTSTNDAGSDTPDAGTATDASTRDAGEPPRDAATRDAAEPSDERDAGDKPDADSKPPRDGPEEPTELDGGDKPDSKPAVRVPSADPYCGCRLEARAQPRAAWCLLAIPLALVLRRRRRTL